MERSLLTDEMERRRAAAASTLAKRQLEFERVQAETQQTVNDAYDRFRRAQGAVVEATRELAAATRLLIRSREHGE